MVPITIVNGVYKPSYNWGAKFSPGLQDATGHLQEFQQRLYEPRFAKTTDPLGWSGQTQLYLEKTHNVVIEISKIYHVIPCYTMLYLEKLGHTVIY
jgi:hypothetical protein